MQIEAIGKSAVAEIGMASERLFSSLFSQSSHRPERDLNTASIADKQHLPHVHLVDKKQVIHAQGEHGKTPGTKTVEANAVILGLCRENVGRHIGAPPDWAPAEMKGPPPSLQCASSASNLYRQALKRAHVIAPNDSHSFRNLEQVQVTKWADAMIGAHLAKNISRNHIKPGDVVIGEVDTSKDPGNCYRHVGFVGEFNPKNHSFAAYSNAGGTFRHQNLDERFGKYKHEYFLRLSLPLK